VHKRLRAQLASVALTKLDESLTYLGDIVLGAETVPCYIARDLKNVMTLQRLDILLRAKSDKGIGLILSAGRDHPLCLGPTSSHPSPIIWPLTTAMHCSILTDWPVYSRKGRRWHAAGWSSIW